MKIADKQRLDYLGSAWPWRIHFNDYESKNIREAIDRHMGNKYQGPSIHAARKPKEASK